MAGIFPDGGTASSQSLGADPSITSADLVNCEGGALFHPTSRCPPRFDPKSANTVVSEIVNLVKCAGVDYNCATFNNLCTAVSALITTRVREEIFGCLAQEFQLLGDACSIEQLVLATDAAGCKRISRYTDAGATIASAANSSVWGLNYPATNHPIPPNIIPDTHIYQMSTLAMAVQTNNVNPNVLNGPGGQNVLGQMSFNLACSTLIEFEYRQTMTFEPQQNGGNGTRSVCVVEIDGNLPLLADGSPINFGDMSNYQGTFSGTVRTTLGPGAHTVRFILVVSGSPEAARVVVSSVAGSTGAIWIARRAS